MPNKESFFTGYWKFCQFGEITFEVIRGSWIRKQAAGEVNAVRDFCSRIRENSDICHETAPKSHDFGYEKRLFSSTKNP